MTATVAKTPSELFDEEIDWSTKGLGADIISASTWASSSGDLIINTPSPTFTNTTTTVWLSAGVAGTIYTVTNTITTSSGRIFQESFLVNVIPERVIT